MNELSFTDESANEFRSRSPTTRYTLHTQGGSFLQDKLSSDRDFQKAASNSIQQGHTVTLFFCDFFHIPFHWEAPMNHENVCPFYSFSCPMFGLLFIRSFPTYNNNCSCHIIAHSPTTTHTRVYVKTFPYHLILAWEWKMILGIVARSNDGW